MPTGEPIGRWWHGVRARRTGLVPRFEACPLPLATENLFDLGVVDLLQRGRLDIFTTNHNSRQSLLLNDGRGVFHEAVSDLGLDHDPNFPGWCDDAHIPTRREPGLHLYRRGRKEVVVESVPPANSSVSATLEFLCPVRVEGASDVAVVAEQANGAAAPPRTVVRVASARRRARAVITPELIGLPLRVRLDEGTPLSWFFVGARSTRPQQRELVLQLRDRHGMAWGDYDGDGRVDAFVARGGLKGRLGQYTGLVNDELLAYRGRRFHDVAATAGIRKDGCRGRQVAWVNTTKEGTLDLFVSCHGSRPTLYRQDRAGTFVDASDVLGEARGHYFAWADVDGDGTPELLAVEGDSLVLYEYRDAPGMLVERQRVPLHNNGGPVQRLALGDYDGDGDVDVFVPSAAGNTCLVNDDGHLRAVDPAVHGLPTRGTVTANWVDYDNDGTLDIHLVPGGLFRQDEHGRFTATGLLEGAVPSRLFDARATWFDSDGSGTRDLVVAFRRPPRNRQVDVGWEARFFKNGGSTNHWLQVVLQGPEQNRPAIGAVLSAEVGDRRLTQRVGCNEGSHFSQGHYRMYVGMGREREADLAVTWPDGSRQHLGGVAANQLVTVTYGRGSTG